VYIDRIVLRDIKGFANADLDLHPEGADYPGWVVITGDNGSGKTALLRAIALAIVGPEDSRALWPDLGGWPTEGSNEGVISVSVRPDEEIDKFKTGRRPEGVIWAEVAIKADDEGGTIDSAEVFRNKKVGARNGPWAHGTEGWFALGYGPFRRMYGTSAEAQRLMMLPGRIPRFATLFKEETTLGEGEEWAKDQDHKELESQRDGIHLASGPLRELIALVRDNYLHRGVTIHRVTAKGILMRDGVGRILPLADMSDGYRSALAMLIDIFRNMIGVYGDDILEEDDQGHRYVDKPGVVLIDEVDAHLHPAWQREIGNWLRGHFPKVQFIVTTHSPLVCATADGGRVYHLPPPGEGEPFRLSNESIEKIVAGRADQILVSPAFALENTRSLRAVEARNRHAKLVSKRIAGVLSRQEAEELEQLALFVDDD
jgi:hypothetical protein